MLRESWGGGECAPAASGRAGPHGDATGEERPSENGRRVSVHSRVTCPLAPVNSRGACSPEIVAAHTLPIIDTPRVSASQSHAPLHIISAGRRVCLRQPSLALRIDVAHSVSEGVVWSCQRGTMCTLHVPSCYAASAQAPAPPSSSAVALPGLCHAGSCRRRCTSAVALGL